MRDLIDKAIIDNITTEDLMKECIGFISRRLWGYACNMNGEHVLSVELKIFKVIPNKDGGRPPLQNVETLREEIIKLRLDEELKYKEIAQQLGVSVGSVFKLVPKDVREISLGVFRAKQVERRNKARLKRLKNIKIDKGNVGIE